jgi:nicotinate-nucleotide--dimethylbenzimidazole phosphoribosyltransferase
VSALEELVGQIGPTDLRAAAAAAERQAALTKPPGSLGRLEQLSVQLASIYGCEHPVLRPRSLILAAADHGVAREGVSAYPSEVTAQMVGNFLAGGAAVNVLSRRADVRVVVLDVGAAAVLEPAPNLIDRKIRRGTANIVAEPAMTEVEALEAIHAGLEAADKEIDSGARLLVTGDMGIGNTTAAAAVVAALLGTDPAAVSGRGTGLDDEGLRRKVAIIEKALSRHDFATMTPLQTLAAVGGFEIAALVGVILGAARRQRPVVLDGYVSGAAGLVAARLAPASPQYAIAGHCSLEPGHRKVLETLELRPLLDLEMRLGEGSGALLALPLLYAAVAMLDEMATFSEAGVSGRAH